MLNGPLFGRILFFALPIALTSMLQQLFNSADMIVVGRWAGPEALAAVGGNSAVINLLVNLFIGLSIGANVAIAAYIGKDRPEKAQDTMHTAMALALAAGVFLLAAGIASARPILELIGTPDEVMGGAVVYLKLYFAGAPFIMIYNFGSAVLRSVGDTRRPLYTLTAAGIVNVLLNLVFVVGFGMGVAGVGLATLISNICGAAPIWFFLLNEQYPVRLVPRRLRIVKPYLLFIIRIGAPAGLQGMVFSLSNVCIQSGINGFGAAAIAGTAAAINFEYFTYYVVNGFNQACLTFTGQNYAACDFDRCRRIYRWSTLGALAICGALCAFYWLFGIHVLRFFSTDADVLALAMDRVHCVCALGFLVISYEVSASALRGMGISMLPALFTLVGSCLLRLVWLVTVFQWYRSYEMLMLVYPVSWIVTGIAMLSAYFIIRHRLFRQKMECLAKEW
ncbi:MAG: MATE family efflux transporter [Mailhella sp.]|nr:MATE family efflux transporter [Mailhella sp.]